jgi:nucleotide-binding universal stress UspA family protein
MKPLTILIPTDFTEVSELAFQMAENIAKKINVKIHVLHVVEAGEDIISENPEASEGIDLQAFLEKEKLAFDQLQELQSRHKDYEVHLKIGLLTNEIRRCTDELKTDLVIIGTHGRDGWMEKLSGSEAQHVARYLQVPVISIRPGTPVLPLKNILLVADFEMFGKGVQINMIKQLAKAFDSTIHLLQILKEVDEPYTDVIQAQMKFFAEEHQFTKFETHLQRDKKVTHGVKNFNQEHEMDLVCIRTHGRKGISHFLFGSIAERLVNHCLKPLLTFHLKTNA